MNKFARLAVGVALVFSFTLPVFAADKPKAPDPISAKIEIVKRLNEAEKEIDKIGQRVDDIKNPYALTFRILSVTVGVVALLLGLGGIYAGVLIHRQSKDFKDSLQKNVEHHNRALKKLKDEHRAETEMQYKQIKEFTDLQRKLISKSVEQLDALINLHKEKLEAASVASKKEIEKAIMDLQKERATTEARTVSRWMGRVRRPSTSTALTTCPECDAIFLRREFLPISALRGGEDLFACPGCGAAVTLPPA